MEFAVLRLVHIAFGVLWAGATITAGWFLIPAMGSAGPASGAVMRGMIARRFPQVMLVSALLSIVSGLRLYQLRFTVAWLGTAEGIVLTAGGVITLSAFALATFVQRPKAMRMGALAAAVAAQGHPPSAEQAAELAGLETRLRKIANATAWHLATVVVLMASMRLAAMLG